MNKLILYILFFSTIINQEIISLDPDHGNSGDQDLQVELTADGINFYDMYTDIYSIYFIPQGNININNYYTSSSNSITLNIDINSGIIDESVFAIHMEGTNDWDYFP